MKVGIIVPYFGKFPNYFQLVLDSCAQNQEKFDWLFFTDDMTEFNYPSNCHVTYMEFSQLREKVQNVFDFKISLPKPYKLCDFRPAYGEIFRDELLQYDFWGHCDIDCIFGDLSEFISDEVLENHDRIFRLGHLCLYRNSPDVNQRFRLPVNGIERFKEVFQSDKNCIFDEHNSSGTISIDTIWENYRFSQFTNDRSIANVYYKENQFRLQFQIRAAQYEREEKKASIFYWADGKILRFLLEHGNLITEEYAYIHLMKRGMRVDEDYSPNKIYKIIPNCFEMVPSLPVDSKTFLEERRSYWSAQYVITRYHNLMVKLERLFKR